MENEQTPVWTKLFTDTGENKADKLANQWLSRHRKKGDLEMVLDFELSTERGVSTLLLVYTAKVEL